MESVNIRAPSAAEASIPVVDDLSPRPADVLTWLVPAYLVLILAGVAVFKFGPVMARGNEMSTTRAVFTAVNAATLTGFPSTVGLEDFETEGMIGPIAVLVLMVGGFLFSTIGGGVAVVRILRLPYSQGQVISAALASLLLATLAGATCLLTHDRRAFDSVFQAASAFTNSGLYIGRLSAPSDLRAQAVLLPLAFIGGLGLPVWMQIFDRLTGQSTQFSPHVRSVFMTSAILYVAATIAFTLLLMFKAAPGGGIEVRLDGRTALASASAAAINARGAGFPFEFASVYPRAMQWLIILLMAIGASPAGAGGGIKATTVAAVCGGARAALHGERVGRAVGVAAVWMAVYAAMVFTGLMLMLWRVADMAADRLLFLVVSAASNVGLAHDPVAITGPGLYTLSSLMLAGRVVPVFVLTWMAATTTDADVAVA